MIEPKLRTNAYSFGGGSNYQEPLAEQTKTNASSNRKIIQSIYKNPIQAFEQLFFAVFGQTSTEHLENKDHRNTWTESLFKIVFGVYMLVSVVVLINLLIAMMTDTYVRIQAQSDIEWKFGLCRLIRNMHRTSTAPSPINLVTTWLFSLVDECKEQAKKKKRPSLVQMVNTLQGKHLSPRSKAAAKWLAKIKRGDGVMTGELMPMPMMHQLNINNPLGGNMGFANQAISIEYVTDWDMIAKKYRSFMGYEEDPKDAETTDTI